MTSMTAPTAEEAVPWFQMAKLVRIVEADMIDMMKERFGDTTKLSR
jgi:hypothetical protein